MDCPVCREPMIVLELTDTEADYCLACRGIWLDSGELEQLVAGSPGGDAVCGSIRPVVGSQEARRPCPICRKEMEKILCGVPGSELKLDRCGGGHGLWFDRDELRDVIKLGVPVSNPVLGLLNDIFGSTTQPS
ncbi:MAG: zf-TFIIB domain-containing protein [Planctomycetota bacterium]